MVNPVADAAEYVSAILEDRVTLVVGTKNGRFRDAWPADEWKSDDPDEEQETGTWTGLARGKQ
jgi:hypothetical protein